MTKTELSVDERLVQVVTGRSVSRRVGVVESAPSSFWVFWSSGLPVVDTERPKIPIICHARHRPDFPRGFCFTPRTPRLCPHVVTATGSLRWHVQRDALPDEAVATPPTQVSSVALITQSSVVVDDFTRSQVTGNSGRTMQGSPNKSRQDRTQRA